MHAQLDPAEPAYPLLQSLLRPNRWIPWLGAAGCAALLCVPAWRLGWVELYAFAAAAGVAVYFALRLALDVVRLVGDTLLPQ